MAIFTKRLTAPSSTDKHYIHYTKGGYNTCIIVNESTGSVMPNCVGYAQGRLLEILQMTKVNWSLPVCNAEDWYDKAQENGLQVSQTPKLGAVACWRAGSTHNNADGAGHVAIVEEIKPNGDIVTSNSAWNGTNFYIQTVTKASGYMYSPSRPLLGFIYCGIDFDNDTPQQEQSKPSNTYNKGDIVRLNPNAKWSNGSKPASWVFNKDLTVIRLNGNLLVLSKDGINGGVTGCINPDDVYLVSSDTKLSKKDDVSKGDIVTFTGNTHYTSSYKTATGKKASPCTAEVTAKNMSSNSNITHPYHLVGPSVHGWVNKEDIKELC